MAITYPHAGATWYTNGSVTLNFTAGEGDAQHWTVLLTNEDAELLAGPQQILQQLNQTNDFVSIRLPQVREGDGYIVQFVNETNQTDVFAKSEAFRIEAGKLPTNNATSALPSSTSSSVHVPVGSKTSTSSGNPFASSAAAGDKAKDSGARAIAPAVGGAAAVAAAVFALL